MVPGLLLRQIVAVRGNMETAASGAQGDDIFSPLEPNLGPFLTVTMEAGEPGNFAAALLPSCTLVRVIDPLAIVVFPRLALRHCKGMTASIRTVEV